VILPADVVDPIQLALHNLVDVLLKASTPPLDGCDPLYFHLLEVADRHERLADTFEVSLEVLHALVADHRILGEDAELDRILR